MRILYFNYLWDIRGASIGSAIKPIELFAALEKRGHTVQICWMKDQPDEEAAKGSKVQIKSFLKKILARFLHDLKLVFENLKFQKMEQEQVNSFKPDVIIARLDLYLYSALKTARKNKVPIIIEADCPPVYEATEFQKQYFRIKALPSIIERKVLQQADFVVMQSNVLQNYFIQKHQLDPHKTAVASNGVDPAKFVGVPRSTELLNKYNLVEKPILGFVGSMSVWHGVDNLQKIVKDVVKTVPQARFLLVGTGGGFEDSLRKFFSKNNLLDNVIFAGYVPHNEIPEYIELMDVVLAPYPKLDFFYYSSVKIFEYMAAGKAVVTTDIGQIAEVITHKHNGYLCPPNDFDAVINSVLHLLANAEERRRIGVNARKTVAEKYSWDHIAQQWENDLERVMSKDLANHQ